MQYKPSEIIIFENEDFIVANKPSGLATIPERTPTGLSLKDILKQKFKNIYTVHRLDKETSGIILFAKNELTHKQLSQLFENRDIEKNYEGLVYGTVASSTGKIEEPIAEHFSVKGKMIVHKNGKPSITDYAVVEQFSLFAWMKFKIYTGRTHQIRVHMSYAGHPIVCDELYGSPEPVYVSKLKSRYHLSKNEEVEKPILSRLALHASVIKFTLNKKEFNFKAALPKDLKAILQQLRKAKI